MLAGACVFLTAKDRGIPFCLNDAARLLYMLEIRSLEKERAKSGAATNAAAVSNGGYAYSGVAKLY